VIRVFKALILIGIGAGAVYSMWKTPTILHYISVLAGLYGLYLVYYFIKNIK